MVEKKKPPRLTPDGLADALAPAGADVPPGVAVLTGLLGQTSDKGTCRLYVDLEMSSYIDIGVDDIRHRETVTNEAGLELSMLWVKKEASLQIRHVSSEQVQADFLANTMAALESGSLASGSLGFTPATPILTKVMCTNFTCTCTSRHSLTCSIVCGGDPPGPRTPDRPCTGGSGIIIC